MHGIQVLACYVSLVSCLSVAAGRDPKAGYHALNRARVPDQAETGDIIKVAGQEVTLERQIKSTCLEDEVPCEDGLSLKFWVNVDRWSSVAIIPIIQSGGVNGPRIFVGRDKQDKLIVEIGSLVALTQHNIHLARVWSLVSVAWSSRRNSLLVYVNQTLETVKITEGYSEWDNSNLLHSSLHLVAGSDTAATFKLAGIEVSSVVAWPKVNVRQNLSWYPRLRRSSELPEGSTPLQTFLFEDSTPTKTSKSAATSTSEKSNQDATSPVVSIMAITERRTLPAENPTVVKVTQSHSDNAKSDKSNIREIAIIFASVALFSTVLAFVFVVHTHRNKRFVTLERTDVTNDLPSFQGVEDEPPSLATPETSESPNERSVEVEEVVSNGRENRMSVGLPLNDEDIDAETMF